MRGQSGTSHLDLDDIDGNGQSSGRRVVPEVASEHTSAEPRILVRVATSAAVAVAVASALSFLVTLLIRAFAS